MEFKTYTGYETLKEEGFTVFRNEQIKNLVSTYSTSLESIAVHIDPKDVFRTELGYIKQIQNLDFGVLNRLLAESIGCKKFEVLNNQYFCKPPNYKMTSAHQDNAYFNSEDEIYTFWIPLQDVDILNSCMFYVPYSQKQGLIPHKTIGTNIRTRTGSTGFSLYSDHYLNRDFVKVPMAKGEILVHDKNTMHFSSPNLSDEYRYAVTAIIKVLK